MTVAGDSFSDMWFGNQAELTGERRREDEERERDEWNILRPEGVRVASPSPHQTVHRRVFSEEEKHREALLIKLIHTILTDFPRFFVDNTDEHVTYEINKEFASKYPHISGKAFERPGDCLEFLQRRRFLFQKRPEDNHHRNTGFAHRITVGQIARLVQEKTSYTGLCSLEDVIDFGEAVFESQRIKLSNDRSVEDGSWSKPRKEYAHMKSIPIEETVRAIVYGYPEFFWTNTEPFGVFVGLTQLAVEIPSLWSDLLPKKPSEPYCDKSRTEVLLAKVTWSRYAYKGKVIEARIQDGLYKKCVIHIFEEYPKDFSKIPKVIPDGSDVIVCAHMVFGRSYQFYGSKVVPVPGGGFDLVDRRTLEMVARSDLNEKKATAAPLVHHRVQYAPLKDLSVAEKSLIKFVDEILGAEPLTEGRFVEKMLAKSPNYEHFFRDPGAAWEFVCERPYLYNVKEQASIVSQVERDAYNALFKYLDRNPNGVKFKGISEAVEPVGYCGPIKHLIRTLGSILSKTQDLKPSIFYFLTACFDKTENILLLGYPNALPPLRVRRSRAPSQRLPGRSQFPP